MKICPVGAELFCVEEQMGGRTDMMRLIFAFHNFANTPKSNALRNTVYE
jgi:hypothetical protein